MESRPEHPTPKAKAWAPKAEAKAKAWAPRPRPMFEHQRVETNIKVYFQYFQNQKSFLAQQHKGGLTIYSQHTWLDQSVSLDFRLVSIQT